MDYSHLQLHKNDFSVWLPFFFWVKFLVLLPLLSLVKLLQSSCSCSPQLALLLFPLQDFFPNLNIPRHLQNRPSEILVNWEVSQEGPCFQFSCSPSERLCSKLGKKGWSSWSRRIVCPELFRKLYSFAKRFWRSRNTSSFSRRHLVFANGFSPSTVQFQWLWLCKKIVLRGAPRLSRLSRRLVQCNKSARLNLNPQGEAKPEHCRCSLIESCKSPSLRSLCVRQMRLLLLRRSMCGRSWNSSRPVFNIAKALDVNSFVKEDGIALLAKHVKLW